MTTYKRKIRIDNDTGVSDDMPVDTGTPDDWQLILPTGLRKAASQLLSYLQAVPVMKPAMCPWCDCPDIAHYPSDPRMYQCDECHRRFTPWTGTPFANCRHQDRWVDYARARFMGNGMHKAGQMTGLSHGACEHREKVIQQLITERWPALMPWWLGQVDRNSKTVAPLRTTPFTSKEEALAHHNHEYIQCLECGKLFSFLGTHLRKAHGMSSMAYREKWQIMKQIPLSGLANRRGHSSAINDKIREGEVDPVALVALMHAANQSKKRKRPFVTRYIGEMHGERLKAQKLWEQSPAIKPIDRAIREQALQRARARDTTGEKIKDIALDIWTLFEMYQEHIDSDAGFTEQELPAINALLEQRLSALQTEYQQQYAADPSPEGMILGRFSARTEKQCRQKIDEYTRQMLSLVDEEEAVAAGLSSVKATQVLLRQQRMFSDEENEFWFFSE
jgi:transposase-like protein